MGKRIRHQPLYVAGQKKKQPFVPQANVYSRGFVPPGYNYLGPGNSLDNGRPTNRDDAVAEEHDYDYRDIEAAGDNPYIKYSEADDVARQNFGGTWGGDLGKAFFGQKHEFAKLGVIPVSKVRKQKRLRSEFMSAAREENKKAAAEGKKPESKFKPPPKPEDKTSSKWGTKNDTVFTETYITDTGKRIIVKPGEMRPTGEQLHDRPSIHFSICYV